MFVKYNFGMTFCRMPPISIQLLVHNAGGPRLLAPNTPPYAYGKTQIFRIAARCKVFYIKIQSPAVNAVLNAL